MRCAHNRAIRKSSGGRRFRQCNGHPLLIFALCLLNLGLLPRCIRNHHPTQFAGRSSPNYRSRTYAALTRYHAIVKPKVYIETSVISYFTSRPSRDLIVAAHQALTSDWWRRGLHRYIPVISQFVLDEAPSGDPSAVRERLEAVQSFALVAAPAAEIERVALELVARRALPAQARYDALHVLVCACAGVDYLATWNYKHLANANKRALMEKVCRECGYEPPRIVTPSELMEV